MASGAVISLPQIETRIFLLRGSKVLLDTDLAKLYGVTTAAFNQAVKRNGERFPADFRFELTREETVQLRTFREDLARRPLRNLPFAFTEQGVAMLSGLLNSARAVAVNIEIMRAFVRLRQMIASHTDLARKLPSLEKKYDSQFKAVFDAIRQLMEPIDEDDEIAAREIGFHTSLKTKDGAAPAKKTSAL
jgi:hypothetical protein